jgi:hypothetical protein
MWARKIFLKLFLCFWLGAISKEGGHFFYFYFFFGGGVVYSGDVRPALYDGRPGRDPSSV